jgi:hypothetical protein
MRPKVVILIMAAAFCVLAMVVVIKGIAGKHATDTGEQTVATNSIAGSTNEAAAQVGANTGVAPVVSPEMRAAVIDKETEQIEQLVGEIDGTNNPVIITALVEKVGNPEAEVRKAALAALVQINDTNSVPELQREVDKLQDPRAKVEVMDTINYLNLPDAMPAVQPPDTFSNQPFVIPPHLKMNPKFMHTNPAILNMQNRQNNGQ